MRTGWRPTSELEKSGLKIVRLLRNKGHDAFFVGGMVRNFLTNLPTDNLDIATSSTPEQTERILRQTEIPIKNFAKKYGTILAATRYGPIEITTFRTESRYTDRRRPDQVAFIKELSADAGRRDFALNAIYLDPLKGQIHDPVGGLRDLKSKIIKFVGLPAERIAEDPLRMMRAVRLSVQLGFRLEKKTLHALRQNAKLISLVSGERIKQELDKILLSKNRALGIRMLDSSGLLKLLIPEIEGIKRFSHKSKMYHLEGTIFEHTLIALSKIREHDLILIYALLFHDIGKPRKAKKILKNEGWVISTKGHADTGADIFRKFCRRIPFRRPDASSIEWLIRNHMTMFDFSESDIKKQLILAKHPAFPSLLKHWHYDESATKRKIHNDDHHRRYLKSVKEGQRLLKLLSEKKVVVDRLTDGKLVSSLSGIKPGPRLGEKIKDVEAEIIEGRIKNPADLKKFLQKNPRRT